VNFPFLKRRQNRWLPDFTKASEQGFPLTSVKIGQWVRLLGARDRRTKCLLQNGLSPGDVLKILNVQNSGSVMVAVGETQLVIGAGLARDLIVAEVATSPAEEFSSELETKTSLDQLSVGEVGKVVGYTQVAKGYKGKLLAMGLTPGAELTVTRVAPLGDPIAIIVRGFHLSLRRQQAAGLLVERLNDSGEDNE
jgi:ferrous iron transport protein A